jgi:acyl-ACP thioesterase
MYSFDGRIRYSETDSEELLTLPGIIDYFQDAAIFHSEDVGVGVSALRNRERAWVLCSWQLEIERYPAFGEKIKISTYPYEFKGFMGSRNCLMTDESGEILVKGNCIWTFIDMQALKPVRVPPEISSCYEEDEKLPMNYKPRKILLPKDGGEELSAIYVEKHHLDSLSHVNNGQYVKIAMEYRKSTGRIKNFRAEYKTQAHLGDKIKPVRYDFDTVEIISLKSETGEVFATVEIEK